MRTMLSAMVAAILAGAVLADETKPCRLDLSSEPDGATVAIDGVARGRAPFTAWDLRPGFHQLRFSLPNYQSEDMVIRLGEGEYLQRSAILEPLRGLLLVTSEPAGCDLSVDGLSLGETPRLVTSLGVGGVHRLTLQKAGYLPQKLEVRFDGRVPVARHVKMVSDSGALKVTSEPAGAEVRINGEVAGVTPLELANVAKGRSVVAFALRGYAAETREISLRAGDEQSLHVQLKGLPGSIRVTSNCRGASVFLDGRLRGKTPLDIDGVEAGDHELRVTAENRSPSTRLVSVGRGEKVSVDIGLESEFGTVSVTTAPAGAQVLLDGRPIGTSRKGASEGEGVVTADGVNPGEHEVTVKLHGYADAKRKVTVEKGGKSELAVSLRAKFTPDVEVESLSGTYRGVMKSNNSDGVMVEISPGVIRTFRHADIRRVNFLETP